MEDVDEVRQHVIVVVGLARHHLFAEGQRHGAIDPGHTEKRHRQSRGVAFT
ncbi:hypothetical protein D3C78_1996080 [compost metagenome]